MTEHNSFFQEIEDDLERKKLEQLWKRYGILVIAGAIAIVAGTGFYSYWHHAKIEKREKYTSALIHIVTATVPDKEQMQNLEDFAKTAPGTSQAVFAQLEAAGIAARTGDNKQAISIYDAVAADSGADPALRQFADLRSVQQQMDSGDAAALLKRLQPLMAEKSAWRYSAMEDSAYLSLHTGDKATAKRLFKQLSTDSDVPPPIAERAADMNRYLDQ